MEKEDNLSNQSNQEKPLDEQSNKNIKGNIFQQNEIYSLKENSSQDDEHCCREQDHENEEETYTYKKKRPLDDPEEYDHLKDICSAFFNYQVDSLRDVARMERDFSSLLKHHVQMLKYDYKERLDKLRKAIWRNYLFLLKIVSPYSHMFKFLKNEKNEVMIQPLRVSPKDIVKMRSTLKLFIREWSSEVSRKIKIQNNLKFYILILFRVRMKEILVINQF
jgi:hypothetical protein